MELSASRRVLTQVAHRLKAMANPIRLEILHTLEDGEMSVGDIRRQVGGSQANISKHLGTLRAAGLVTSRREGVVVYYRVADEIVFAICRSVCDSLLAQAESEVRELEATRASISRPSR